MESIQIGSAIDILKTKARENMTSLQTLFPEIMAFSMRSKQNIFVFTEQLLIFITDQRLVYIILKSFHVFQFAQLVKKL